MKSFKFYNANISSGQTDPKINPRNKTQKIETSKWEAGVV
jgi:hypothetical protein